jgi:hypothetical protein
MHFSSIDNVFNLLNALVIKTLTFVSILRTDREWLISEPKHVGAFYQTVLEYFSVFITSAFSW